jgi:hypothetical protein
VRCAEDGQKIQAAEWALIHGETGQDPWADYVALCRHCHQVYDDHAGYKRGKTRAEIFGLETSEQVQARLQKAWATRRKRH